MIKVNDHVRIIGTERTGITVEVSEVFAVHDISGNDDWKVRIDKEYVQNGRLFEEYKDNALEVVE